MKLHWLLYFIHWLLFFIPIIQSRIPGQSYYDARYDTVLNERKEHASVAVISLGRLGEFADSPDVRISLYRNLALIYEPRPDIFLCTEELIPTPLKRELSHFFSHVGILKKTQFNYWFERYIACYNFYLAYARTVGKHYDWVVRTRPDFFYYERPPPIMNLDPSHIYVRTRVMRFNTNQPGSDGITRLSNKEEDRVTDQHMSLSWHKFGAPGNEVTSRVSTPKYRTISLDSSSVNCFQMDDQISLAHANWTHLSFMVSRKSDPKVRVKKVKGKEPESRVTRLGDMKKVAVWNYWPEGMLSHFIAASGARIGLLSWQTRLAF